MILLDENFPESQRELLRGWRIPARQIGVETGRKGMADDEIIPLLLRLRRPTFFTLDFDFYRHRLCHSHYCLVCLDVGQYEAATFARRLLNHREFDTEAKRMGTIIDISQIGLAVWRVHAEQETRLGWAD